MAKCEICGQWMWIKDLDERGNPIQVGHWDNGTPKYKVHKHQCGPPVGPGLDSLHKKVTNMSTEAAEFVKERAHSDHVNLAHLTASMAIIKASQEKTEQYVQIIAEYLKEGKLMFQSGSSLIKRNPEPQEVKPFTHDKNESDFSDEIAGTDDTTASPDANPSINFMDRRTVETD